MNIFIILDLEVSLQSQRQTQRLEKVDRFVNIYFYAFFFGRSYYKVRRKNEKYFQPKQQRGVIHLKLLKSIRV